MFEVVGSDIERLSDAELRSLVLRLASSELRKQGLPISAVTAAGIKMHLMAVWTYELRVQLQWPGLTLSRGRTLASK